MVVVGGVVIVLGRESVKILGDYKENKRKCDAEFHKINDLTERPVYVSWMKVQSEGGA